MAAVFNNAGSICPARTWFWGRMAYVMRTLRKTDGRQTTKRMHMRAASSHLIDDTMDDTLDGKLDDTLDDTSDDTSDDTLDNTLDDTMDDVASCR